MNPSKNIGPPITDERREKFEKSLIPKTAKEVLQEHSPAYIAKRVKETSPLRFWEIEDEFLTDIHTLVAITKAYDAAQEKEK